MSECLSPFEWGPIGLALIPLVLAVAVLIAERMGWADTGSPDGSSGCRCSDDPGS
jgi:hypothetical protein